jgi:DNA processing protein
VFAVPGSPLDPRAEGTNGLIKQGAALVTGVDDILNVIQPMLHRPFTPVEEPESVDQPVPQEPDHSDRGRIVNLMGPVPVALDDLVRLSGASPAIVRVVLLELDIAGRLQRHGDGLVSLLS